MAFAKAVKVNGDSKEYVLSDNVKKFTLKDLGFIETKAGNYSFERSVDPNSPFNGGFKVKLMISKDLAGFKMAITTGNGLQKVNIFADSDKSESVKQFRFLMESFIERSVFNQISE